MSEVSSLGEAKAHLSELVARVGGQHDRVTVTVHGRPVAVLVAVDDLESLEETIAANPTTPRWFPPEIPNHQRQPGPLQDAHAP